MNNEIQYGKVRFSFICINDYARDIDVRKHGFAWITEKQYNSIMDILYGETKEKKEDKDKAVC